MERNRMLGMAVALAAAGAIIGAAAGGSWLWLHYVCKPLTTVLVLCTAVWGEGVVPRYQRWVVAGLLLSLTGDVFLMLPGDFFVPGLVAFLLAHVCYIAAFIPGVRLLRSPGIGLVLVAYGAANVLPLWPYLEDALRALWWSTCWCWRQWCGSHWRAGGRCLPALPVGAPRAVRRWARCCSSAAIRCWPGIALPAPCRCRRWESWPRISSRNGALPARSQPARMRRARVVPLPRRDR